jgi:hypothetical protein
VLAALVFGAAAASAAEGDALDTKVRGRGVTFTWELDRTEVPEDGALTATLVVAGEVLQDPNGIPRPDLGKLPAFKERFRQIENVPGPTVQPDAKRVTFAYRLRPRAVGESGLPAMSFEYYNLASANPEHPQKDPGHQTARFKGLRFHVVPAAKITPPPPVVRLDAPESAFEAVTGPQVFRREPFAPDAWTWAAAFALAPVLAIAWFAVWRRLYPDAARLARLGRRRAARRAADAIRRAGHTPDPAGAVAAAVLGYLQSRFPLPPGADTPAGIGDGLRTAGLSDADADDVVRFFRHCDEARFAAHGDGHPALAADADALLARLEAGA